MNERTVNSRVVFEGCLLKIEVLDVELESGECSVREVVRHPGAAVVLPQLQDGRFVLVRQFRKPIERDVLEVVAGVLEPGETPENCAVRELKEETGYEPEIITKLGVVFPSPGYTDETLHMYHALLGWHQGELSPDDDEKLEVVCLSGERIEEMMARGEIFDAKTIAIWQLHRMGAGSRRENEPDA